MQTELLRKDLSEDSAETEPLKRARKLLRSWKTVQREQIADCRVFSVHRQISLREHDALGETHDFYVFKPRDWVNVIAVTPENEVVLIVQYRHGVENFTLEIPGGMVDLEDESSAVAGGRELLEETGYGYDELIFLGQNHPNPAIQSNVCDTYLALGARPKTTPRFDSTEEVAIKLVPMNEIESLIRNNTISHALVVVAFQYLHLFILDNPAYEYLNPYRRQ
jgi:ADP-ribose pyrophosphatase